MKKNILITGGRGFIGRHIIGGSLFKGRISKQNLLKQIKGIKGIVHLAAKSSRMECYDNPNKCIESNVNALCSLLDIALENNLWVLFISTLQVKDQTLYGLSKLIGEELCRLYQSKGLRVSILRLPIVYGPNDKKNKLVTKFITKLKKGEEPIITTREKFYFSYVNDVAKRIETGVTVNAIKDGTPQSLTSLIKGIKKCLKEEKND